MMHVNILMPDAARLEDVREALRFDEAIIVSEGRSVAADIRLIHSSMLPVGASALRELTSADGAVIVTAAPRDPEILAGYLASGVSGYHFAGEPWTILLDVIRKVHAGEYRHDPYVISHLLENYRRLRRRSSKTNGFGPFLH